MPTRSCSSQGQSYCTLALVVAASGYEFRSDGPLSDSAWHAEHHSRNVPSLKAATPAALITTN
jgi:hypothetical protein